ncbi:hypothetical protein GCM10009733_061060 [Nonomuraea maheshkhaliensis]|uniref:Uncharacterized protein n=1 Tax=Nonomuraea maheshkhaliensis TaxID=419590 RepID=A0ABN2FPQ4_9ACTN
MLGDGEFYGFGVDTGMGCFLDASGRDAGGDVTAFVADLLVLHDADALPPTAPSTVVCLPSFIPVADDRRETPLT